MDCPHCKTSNPVGAATCGSCHTPLTTSAITAVAQLTPPADSAVTIVDVPPDRLYKSGQTTLDGFAASTMEIPTAWSVPPSPEGYQDARASLASVKPGSLLGNRYEIVKILGEGGMGAVYQARDRELDRTVALKVIRPELAGQPEILQRFKQELILARKVTHRNVIRIFDLGEASGIKFITMEFIEGQDLKSVLAQSGKLPPERAAGIVQQVCLALEAAHSEGVVHRDLKPQNIMMDAQGRVAVMDFGIARSLEFGGMTQTGALIGTPEYMSPEQVRGEHVDARSDLFTLGIIFQELLTGKLPYAAATAMASMFKRTTERAPSVRMLDPSVPPYLSEICAKCLEIDPNARFQSARELCDALEDWKRGSGTTVRLQAVRWVRQGLRGWRWVAAGAALALLAITAFILRNRFSLKPATAHAPVTVLVADFTNHTGDPVFDNTLEPMFNVALEGASFINAYNRGNARKLAEKLPNPTEKLDEQPARLVALSQGISTVIAGEISRRGNNYAVSAIALDAATGNVVAQTEATAANKDAVVGIVPKLVAPIRKALGDATPESAQLERAGGAFTAASLEVVHQYGLAMEEQFAGKTGDALKSFGKTAELDPNFARAYSGMAAAAIRLDRPADAEKYIKSAMEHVDRMTDRERYRVRGLYYGTTGNWEKCAEEYGALVKSYPGDNIGHNNLAICLSKLRNFPGAIAEARLDNQMHPNALAQSDVSLFASYSGDFQNGEAQAREVRQLYPSSEYGYLALAFAQLGQEKLTDASDTYTQLAQLGEHGASLSNWGLADMALFQGRFADAVRMLEKGASSDLAAKNNDAAAEKFATLAYAQLWMQRKAPAIAAADNALANSQSVKVRLLSALVYAETGQQAKAQKVAESLASEVQSEAQADAKIIEADLALSRKDATQAVRTLTEADTLLDTWLGHFELGRAYLEANAFAEADSEFDQCLKRRGETLSLFMDDVPSYGFFPPVYYYQARVREGLKSPGFAESYRTYLSIRGQAGEDPLLADIRRRLGQ